MLNISGIIEESIVDGDGIRFTIFTQGCPHHCAGCHNKSTWEIKENQLVNEDDIVKKISDNFLLDGVTFSGGEPFLQTEPLIYIAKKVHELNKTVWSYTGFVFEYIITQEGMKNLLENIDVLVDGKFVLEQRDISLKFKGSANQRIIDIQESLKQNKVILKYE